MLGFIVGLLLGVAGKTIYDLFKEDQLPADMGLNTGRIEALLDETRQTVRDLREEVRQAMAGEGTVQEKASRVVSAATEVVKSGKAGEATAGQGAAPTEERLTVAGSGAGEAESGTGGTSSGGSSSAGGSSGSSQGSGESRT